MRASGGLSSITKLPPSLEFILSVESCTEKYAYRRCVEKQHVSSSDYHEPRAITLPRMVVVQHALVHPSHVLDFLVNAEIQIVQFDLERGA